jgi:hypothetical protein
MFAFTLMHLGQHLLLDGLNHLYDLSVGGDHLADLLDDWFSDFVDELMGLVVGVGVLVTALGASVLLLHVHRG